MTHFYGFATSYIGKCRRNSEHIMSQHFLCALIPCDYSIIPGDLQEATHI